MNTPEDNSRGSSTLDFSAFSFHYQAKPRVRDLSRLANAFEGNGKLMKL